jgi:predicted CoA-binding protein
MSKERVRAVSAKTVAVIGASADRSKYGNKAVRAFQEAGWTVYPVHPTLEEVEGVRAYPNLDALPVGEVDQVSLYVPARVGIQILDQVARKRARELWVNPGSESPELLDRASELGLSVIQACSILGVGEYPGDY